mmetsp:Transcript_5359/g.11874  ORF Transcript_5359/g.11874 Transcript_5359/m.11874 type:complete len:417 (+) Transcript_5359:50-1300(+)
MSWLLGTLDASEVDPNEEEELGRKRDETVKELEDLEILCGPLLEILRDEEQLQTLINEENFNQEYLFNEMGINSEAIEAFYRYGKFNYECGNYQDVIYIMLYYRELAPESPNAFYALWGKTSSELLMLKTTDNVVNALKDVLLLQKLIDEREESPEGPTHHLEQLQFRSWLLHWSLFLFFKSDICEPDETSDGAAAGDEYPSAKRMPEYLRSQMIEFFTARHHIDAIQANCPWLLRYLAAAVVCSPKKHRKFRSKLVSVIQQEQYTFRDPLTQFVECLYVKFDFEAAQERLKECEVVLSNDFFLESVKDLFMENARLAIFEIYCRIHTKIDTKMLSARIDLGTDDSEEWIVNLIREARLDAKIDSEQNCVVMSAQHPEVYQQIIDKTKDLTYRSYQLANEVQQLYQKTEQAASTSN